MKVLGVVLLALNLLTAGCFSSRKAVNKSPKSSPKKPIDDGTDRPTTPQPGLSRPPTGSATGSSTLKCWDEGIADGEQTLDYYELRNVIGAGTGNRAPQWVSTSRLTESSASPSILVSDSRVHLRILALSAPSKGGRCKNIFDYGALSMKIAIWGASSSGPLQELEFNNVKVGECSPVLRFARIPANSESSPFVLKIREVLWDYDCKWDPDRVGCATSPFKRVWTGSCWKIELHIATDDTKDIPR